MNIFEEEGERIWCKKKCSVVHKKNGAENDITKVDSSIRDILHWKMTVLA